MHGKGETMSDVLSKAEARSLRASDDGLFMSGVNLGADVVQGAVTGTFGVAKAIRSEAFRLTNSWIEWAESVQTSTFKVMREIVTRLDDGTRGTVDGIESVSMGFTGLVRMSGEAAGEMISRTTASIIGKKHASQKAA